MYRILELNPQLQPFAGDIDLRMHLYNETKSRLLSDGGSLNDFANAHAYFGIHHVDFATQKRTPKLSALWYKELIRRNALV